MVHIDLARTDDHDALVALFQELETGDPAPDRAQFEALAPTTLFARDEQGRRLGYAFFQLFGAECFVRHLVSAPEARRRGVGRALMAEVARRARAAGAHTWRLNVRSDNQPALRLYEALGFARALETVVLRVTWRALGPEEASPVARAIADDERAQIERAFELPSGLVQHARGKVLVATFEAGRVTSFGCFDPTFPGVYPLRATRVDAALATLRALGRAALPIEDEARPWRRDGVQIVVEDAEAVAQALLARGAREVFRITQLRGELPDPGVEQ